MKSICARTTQSMSPRVLNRNYILKYIKMKSASGKIFTEIINRFLAREEPAPEIFDIFLA
jgi:recombinational DNA repair protein (RecF pathway)